ncbi:MULTISPECIES: hypothetical protein [unclassified Pseudoalteromonas]|uniref:hypothetical protein n=1 Tax=unclassified Pseudoalteromonas TaxID=194690 RepID=UPI00110B88CC|nr:MULTISPECIES: hypothetical protein [unclassified Pseudoalteromonas]TMP48423.1 hypothetical protein CWB80_03930 [Pseudoalteromonas sp. S1650]TMP66511.1 hypothetical protein CWB79_11635 [Pseudoalteromonas sp. S1649]
MSNDEIKKFFDDKKKLTDSLNTLDQILTDKREREQEEMEKAIESISKVRLNKQQDEFLSYFWHPLRQEVIEEIELAALEHMYFLKKQVKSIKGNNALKVYRSMFNNGSELFDSHEVSEIPKIIKLSKKGVAYVMKKNPIYSQFSLLFLKFWKNKFAVFCTVISVVSGTITIIGIY